MTATTASAPSTPKKASRLNRFDSPWLNSKFIAGLCMVGFAVLLGLIGPLF